MPLNTTPNDDGNVVEPNASASVSEDNIPDIEAAPPPAAADQDDNDNDDDHHYVAMADEENTEASSPPVDVVTAIIDNDEESGYVMDCLNAIVYALPLDDEQEDRYPTKAATVLQVLPEQDEGTAVTTPFESTDTLPTVAEAEASASWPNRAARRQYRERVHSSPWIVLLFPLLMAAMIGIVAYATLQNSSSSSSSSDDGDASSSNATNSGIFPNQYAKNNPLASSTWAPSMMESSTTWNNDSLP